MVKTITGLTIGEAKTRPGVTQTGTTTGGRITVSVGIVVTGVTVTGDTVITATTTGSNHPQQTVRYKDQIACLVLDSNRQAIHIFRTTEIRAG